MDELLILLNIINNYAADALTCQVKLAIKKANLQKNVIIICMHSIATEKKAINVRAF